MLIYILEVGRRNQKYEYKICSVKLESVRIVKDLSVTIASNLKYSQQCKDAADKTNRMLGFINKFSFTKQRSNASRVYQISQNPLGACGAQKAT